MKPALEAIAVLTIGIAARLVLAAGDVRRNWRLPSKSPSSSRIAVDLGESIDRAVEAGLWRGTGPGRAVAT